MRNPSLHASLETFTGDAASRLAAEAQNGAEIPFELVAEPGGTAPLYCYRPLTGRFIGERVGLLSALGSYAPAAQALAALDGLDDYLRQRGEHHPPADPRERADEALRLFLARVFADRSQFGFDSERFAAAYAELERVLYEGKHTTTVVTPLLGLALDHGTREIVLGDGLALVRGDCLDSAPHEAVWGEGREPNVLASLTVTEERDARSPLSAARSAFRRLLTTLRLFERGGFALGPLAWARTDGGEWRAVSLGASGRPRSVTFISGLHEDELRAFHNLIARRAPVTGEAAWALARFEMGCERIAPFESLTDYLLALRALLEPEGPASGRLAGRLAAVCAQPGQRSTVTERVARTAALERSVISGLALSEPGIDLLVSELAEYLRAILRDLLCGHLDADVCRLADALLADVTLSA